MWEAMSVRVLCVFENGESEQILVTGKNYTGCLTAVMSGKPVSASELGGTLIVADEVLAMGLKNSGYRVELVSPRRTDKW